MPHRAPCSPLTWDDGPRAATPSGSPERAAAWAKARVASSTTPCSLNACSTIEIHAANTIHASCQHQTTSRQPMMHARRAAACLPLPPIRRRPGPGLRVRALARRCLQVASRRLRRHALCPRWARRRGDGRPSSWRRGGRGACRGTPTPELRQQLEQGSLFKADGRPASSPIFAGIKQAAPR